VNVAPTYNQPELLYGIIETMFINVAQLLKEPVGTKRSYRVDELAGESGEDHVEGEVTLTRTNRGVLVTGELQAQIHGSCDRCLGPACVNAVLKIEDEYLPVIDVNTGARVEADPDSLRLDQNHVLDLDEAIRQYIIMSTPTKLLCAPECPGICPVCGHELAKGDCGHVNRSPDKRWEKLAQLQKEK
jgi:uncharacterized protein